MIIKNKRYNITCLIFPKSYYVETTTENSDIEFSNDFEMSLDNLDGIIFLNCKQKEAVIRKIFKVLELGKEVVCCLHLNDKECDEISCYAQQHGTIFSYLPKKQNDLKTNSIASEYFLPQECIVIAVGSLTPKLNNNSIILRLIEELEKNKYTVAPLVTDNNLLLCGYYPLINRDAYDFEDDYDSFIFNLNTYINSVQIRCKPEIMIVQLPPEGLYRLYDDTPFGFGTKNFMVSQALNIDYFVLHCGLDIPNDFIYQEISKCFENRYSFHIDAVVVDNYVLDYEKTMENFDVRYQTVPEDAVNEYVGELKNDSSSDILYCDKCNHLSEALIVKDIVNQLSKDV